jgi:hypothetical protein
VAGNARTARASCGARHQRMTGAEFFQDVTGDCLQILA